MIQEALSLLSKGLSVVPISPGGKLPPTEWKRFCETKASETEVRGWYEQNSLLGLGVVCGPVSDILLLDVDGTVGPASIKGRPIPVTPTARTANNGLHFYFKWDSKLNGVPTTRRAVLPGVDTRGAGGLGVLPPTKGASGSPYFWMPGRSLHTCPLASAPDWLMSLLLERDKQNPVSQSARYAGPRHPEFIRIMGGYLGKGLTREETWDLMKEWNAGIADPFDEPRFKKEFEGYYKYWERGHYTNKQTRDYLNHQEQQPLVKSNLRAVPLNEFMSQGEAKIDWIVDGFIPTNSFVFLGGFAKIGKSWLMLDLAEEMTRGGKWLGLFPVKKGTVLYLDQENPDPLIRVRVSKTLRGKGLKAPDTFRLVTTRGLKVDTPAGYETLSALIEEVKPTLVIGDAFIRFHDQPENDATSMAKVNLLFASLIKKHGCTFLFADHETWRGSSQDGQPVSGPGKLRGSGEKYAFCDMAYSLTKSDGLGVLTLHHTYSRWAEQQQNVNVAIQDVSSDSTVVRGSR